MNNAKKYETPGQGFSQISENPIELRIDLIGHPSKGRLVGWFLFATVSNLFPLLLIYWVMPELYDEWFIFVFFAFLSIGQLRILLNLLKGLFSREYAILTQKHMSIIRSFMGIGNSEDIDIVDIKRIAIADPDTDTGTFLQFWPTGRIAIESQKGIHYFGMFIGEGEASLILGRISEFDSTIPVSS